MKAGIIDAIACIAGDAFGEPLEIKISNLSTPESALRKLVRAVPKSVPVALLVDEYDQAIMQDVSKGRWAAARAGVEALRSLLMSTKSIDFGSRITRCIFTGVARFANTLLHSGANNFKDMTADPLTSRVLGFSRAEIRASFPDHLRRLATSRLDGATGKHRRRVALDQLQHWYDGYCFDGKESNFNPFPVLSALNAGSITLTEMDAASGTNWLGLTAGDVLLDAFFTADSVPRTTDDIVDLAGPEAGRVSAVSLLMQTGLLTLVPGEVSACRPPNEFARRSLQRMLEHALAVSEDALPLPALAAALTARNQATFEEEATRVLELVPNSLIKEGVPREAPFHAALLGAILSSVAPSTTAVAEVQFQRGRADVVVTFPEAPATTWIFEVGLGDSVAELRTTLDQAK